MTADRPLRIGPMEPNDWSAVRSIYGEGLAAGDATFEEALPDWEQWDAAHHRHCRLVARSGRDVVGWACLLPVSRRAVYAGVAEVSVYVAHAWRGRGVGRELMRHLVDASEAAGIWTLQSSVFPENEASLSLHRSTGFREVGRRERIGRMRGRWRDVILLERRSATVGR